MEQSLTIVKAADYLLCGVSTLRSWIRQGRAPKHFRIGNRIRFRLIDLNEWIDMGGSQRRAS